MRKQYFPQASINLVVLDGQNDHVDALTVHQLDRLVQKSPWTLEVLWHGPTSHPHLCGEISEMDLKGCFVLRLEELCSVH